MMTTTTNEPSQHTPGPWAVAPVPESYQPGEETCAYIVDSQQRTIADCWPEEDPVPPNSERLANARLIAAAPVLLDVAEEYLGEHNANGRCECRICEVARAAIAKARG